ncbi:hypothetical protein R1flu_004968 [Riccia fluitans]|uniref:Coiled-coil domain-containing protein 153 n=1 Tax=Riccia fluitans TaxID=41844 RepID=A0ABD1YUM8_9MARC
MSLVEITSHFSKGKWKEEKHKLQMEARNATWDKLQAKDEVTRVKLQYDVLQSELQTKDETLRITTEDYTGKINELTKKNGDVLRMKLEFEKTIAELKKEKNALEAKLVEGEDLWKKLIPILSSYVTSELDVEELSLLRAFQAEVDQAEGDADGVKSRLSRLRQKVDRELGEIRANVGVQLEEMGSQLGLF